MTAENFNTIESILVRRIEELYAHVDHIEDDNKYDEAYQTIINTSYQLVELIRGKEYIAQVKHDAFTDAAKGFALANDGGDTDDLS